eukprot:308948_1
MLQNDHSDSVQIDTIKIQTASDLWYGIDICRDTMLGMGENYVFHGDNSLCTIGFYNYEAIPIDNDPNDMGPYKQIIYFDLSTPNTYIKEASWADGTNPEVTPQTDSCEPTANPTLKPTVSPSDIPTNIVTNDQVYIHPILQVYSHRYQSRERLLVKRRIRKNIFPVQQILIL